MERSFSHVLYCSLFVLATIACTAKDETAAVAAEKKEEFSMSREQLVKLNDNEWAELERRCLGVSSSTCDLAKSESVTNSRDLDKAFKNANKTMDKLTGR